ncbi:MAG: ParB N-terminal domain-containing protein [Halioglobus sp.]
MALKKRRRADTQSSDDTAVASEIAETDTADVSDSANGKTKEPKKAKTNKTTTLDAPRSAASVQAQVDERLAPKAKNNREESRLVKIALAKISPDPDNERTGFINQGTITILANAFKEVWEEGGTAVDIPEAVLTRTLDQVTRYAESQAKDLPPIEDVTSTLKGIWDFAVHLKTEPLLQPFTVTLGREGKYQVVFGHRRFMASYIAHGDTHEIECVNYLAAPNFPASKRFVENNQRVDLPLQAKVEDFKKAVKELRKHASNRVSNIEIANKLGVGRNLVQRLEKISSCSEVNLLMATGQIRSLEFAYKMAVLEGSDKPAFKMACKRVAEKGEPTGDFAAFKAELAVQTTKKPARPTAGRPSKIKFPALSQPKVLQKLFAPEVLENPQWQRIDWEDTTKPNIEKIETLIKKTLETLVKDMEASAKV